MAGDAEMRASFGKAARALVEEKFSAEAIGKATVALYQSLVPVTIATFVLREALFSLSPTGRGGRAEPMRCQRAGAVGAAHHGGDAVVSLDARGPADGAELRSVDDEIPRQPLPLGLLAEGGHQPLDPSGRDADEMRRPAQAFAHGGNHVSHADRLGVGDEKNLAFGLGRGQREFDRRGEVLERKQRAAIVEPAEGQRHRRLRERCKARDIAFDAASIDHGGTEHGEGNAALGNQALGLEL